MGHRLKSSKCSLGAFVIFPWDLATPKQICLFRQMSLKYQIHTNKFTVRTLRVWHCVRARQNRTSCNSFKNEKNYSVNNYEVKERENAALHVIRRAADFVHQYLLKYTNYKRDQQQQSSLFNLFVLPHWPLVHVFPWVSAIAYRVCYPITNLPLFMACRWTPL